MEKYILLSTFATLTQEELELTKDWEETPLAVVAIAQEYIERWVLCSDYKSLDDFLNTSTMWSKYLQRRRSVPAS